MGFSPRRMQRLEIAWASTFEPLRLLEHAEAMRSALLNAVNFSHVLDVICLEPAYASYVPIQPGKLFFLANDLRSRLRFMIMGVLVQAAMTFAHPIANIADHDLDGAWPRLTHSFCSNLTASLRTSTYPTMSSMTACD